MSQGRNDSQADNDVWYENLRALGRGVFIGCVGIVAFGQFCKDVETLAAWIKALCCALGF